MVTRQPLDRVMHTYNCMATHRGGWASSAVVASGLGMFRVFPKSKWRVGVVEAQALKFEVPDIASFDSSFSLWEVVQYVDVLNKSGASPTTSNHTLGGFRVDIQITQNPSQHVVAVI
jgi:hypothetical protein